MICLLVTAGLLVWVIITAQTGVESAWGLLIPVTLVALYLLYAAGILKNEEQKSLQRAEEEERRRNSPEEKERRRLQAERFHAMQEELKQRREAEQEKRRHEEEQTGEGEMGSVSSPHEN